MVTEKQMAKLKKLLLEQKKELTGAADVHANELTSRASLRDATDELSTVDNHPADLATELYEREKDMALKVHSEEELAQVEAAFMRMENGTYGRCTACGTAIAYDRLRAIPHTAFCMAHSEAKTPAADRPVEEQRMLPAVDNSFSGRERDDAIQDNEDSFQVVAQYGNSDTPADFEGDFDHYNDLYKDKDGDMMYTDLEFLHVSREEYLTAQISKHEAEEARKHDYSE